MTGRTLPRPLFTSERERRLWLWVAVVMVAIYTTLGPAQAIAEALRERNLLRIVVSIVVATVAGIVATQWIKQRPGKHEIGVAVGIVFVYAWTLARAVSPEERTHLIEYSVVALLVHQALTERRRNGRRVPVPALLTVAVTVALGWLDEGIQSLLPNRVYDLRDVGFNTFAAGTAIAAKLSLAYARRWARRRRTA